MWDLRALTWAPGARFILAAVALALFGLLSMHGWGSHTGGHTMTMAPASSAVSTNSSETAGHGRASMTDGGSKESSSQTAGGSASTRGHEKPDGDPGASLLGLCLVVLGGLLLGIALLWARRGIRIPPWLLPTWPHSVLIGRERDPPDLLQLCVIRC
jgi:hypothetical protein